MVGYAEILFSGMEKCKSIKQGTVMSVIKEQKTITAQTIQCDFCDYKSSGQMHKCFGCGKDLCVAHTIYDNLYLDHEASVYLCVDCHASFAWTNLEASQIISGAHEKADALISAWKASRGQQVSK